METEELYERVTTMGKPELTLHVQPRAVKVSDAAKMMGTSEKVVRNLVKEGYLKAMKFPAITISIREIERFLDVATDKQTDFSGFGSSEFKTESKIIPLMREEN